MSVVLRRATVPIEIPRRDEQRGQKDQPDGPWPLAILQIAVVVAQIQRNRAGDRSQVEQHESDPCEPRTVQSRAGAARGDVVGKPDQSDARPAIERGVGVDRPQPPEGQPLPGRKIRRAELVGHQYAHGRGKQQPECRRHRVGAEHRGQRSVIAVCKGRALQRRIRLHCRHGPAGIEFEGMIHCHLLTGISGNAAARD